MALGLGPVFWGLLLIPRGGFWGKRDTVLNSDSQEPFRALTAEPAALGPSRQSSSMWAGKQAAHRHTRYLMRLRKRLKCLVKTADAKLPLPSGPFEKLFAVRIVAYWQSPQHN